MAIDQLDAEDLGSRERGLDRDSQLRSLRGGFDIVVGFLDTIDVA
jgi:hypothetical protein